MNISKSFTKSGAGGMTQVTTGHGVDFATPIPAVRVTLHKPTGTMAHLSMSPAEARELAQHLLDNANKIDAQASVAVGSKEFNDSLQAQANRDSWNAVMPPPGKVA